MAVRLVERRGAEFQPQPAVTRPPHPHAWPAPRPAARGPNTFLASHRDAGSLTAIGGAALLLAGAVYFGLNRAAPTAADGPAVRLAVAAVMGLAVTAVHKRVRGGRSIGHSLVRAQTLLCVAGAMTMILIDNSIARAFGIAGAASIVRFRTPIDDPTDATVMFLLMALGMASGVGAFGLALAGGAGVCVLLFVFGAVSPEGHRRSVTFELAGSGFDFPRAHVEGVFAKHGIAIEPTEWSQDGDTRVKYRASVEETLSLEAVGAELMNGGQAALTEVRWDVKKSV